MKPLQFSFQRVEKKYMMTKTQYYRLLEALEPHVRPDDYPLSTICNVYYDTPDYLLIRRSIEKPVYKEKFRLRSYGIPGKGSPVFLEIKKKYDGVVYKRRIKTTVEAAVPFLEGGSEPLVKDPQILHEIEWFFHSYRALQPGMFLAYDREAFVGVQDPNLRITFDTNIRYRTDHLDLREGDFGTYLLPEDKVLMEIKIPGSAPLWLCDILSRLKIYPASFSKYGRCYLKSLQDHTIELTEEPANDCA